MVRAAVPGQPQGHRITSDAIAMRILSARDTRHQGKVKSQSPELIWSNGRICQPNLISVR